MPSKITKEVTNESNYLYPLFSWWHGKSNTTANLTAVLAQKGYRVGVIDTDIQSPGIHVLFGLQEDDVTYALNNYLNGECGIEDAAYDVTHCLNEPAGKIFLIPSSIEAGEITRILQEGIDFSILNDGFYDLVDELSLDVLLIDTHPGLNKETLLSITVSDSLLIILRPDRQDYMGTGVTVDVARQLDVPHLMMLVNKVPQSLQRNQVIDLVEKTYGTEVAGLINHSDEMMLLASEDLFVVQYPDHAITKEYELIAEKLMAAAV